MTERVAVAGASGFIGRYLVAALRAEGSDVTTIGRSGSDVAWEDAAGLAQALDGADLVVNLAGKSVDCRYTPANRAEILRSRIDTTRALREAIAATTSPPALWINSSTATIYRHAEDRPMTESTGELGQGFSVSIAKAWERELFEGSLPATRRVALRMAIVLGDGSALAPLARLTKIGFGGPHWDGPWFSTRARREAGTFHEFRARWGRQRFSWIHVADVVRIVRFIQSQPQLEGVVNASAPAPTDNVGFMQTLRRVLSAPFGVPMPRILLELGSIVIRTETELVLKSRWVLPETIEAAGYEFAFPELEPALRDILNRT